jgi:hypothetical protein
MADTLGIKAEDAVFVVERIIRVDGIPRRTHWTSFR